MPNRSLLLALLMFALSACGEKGPPGSVPPEPARLVGLWESNETTRGGIGNYVELRADGTCARSLCVMLDVSYELEGARLRLGVAEEKEGERPVYLVEFRGNEMLLRPADGTADPEALIRKYRLTPAVSGSSPIVGDWAYGHTTGVTAYERYTPEGRMQLRIPMAATDPEGRYRVLDGEIEFTFGKAPATPVKYARDGAELRFLPEDKAPSVYRRAAGGGWYRPPDDTEIERLLERKRK